MIKPKDEYILFADETKKTPQNPYFCFAGFIIKRCNYEDILVPKINSLKQKHFGRTDIDLPWEKTDKTEVFKNAVR